MCEKHNARPFSRRWAVTTQEAFDTLCCRVNVTTAGDSAENGSILTDDRLEYLDFVHYLKWIIDWRRNNRKSVIRKEGNISHQIQYQILHLMITCHPHQKKPHFSIWLVFIISVCSSSVRIIDGGNWGSWTTSFVILLPSSIDSHARTFPPSDQYLPIYSKKVFIYLFVKLRIIIK